MSQDQFTDHGVSNWRTVKCPMCGGIVAWTIARPYNAKVVCDNTPGEGKRGKKPECGFTMKRAEWDYLRERPHMAPSFRKQFGKEKEPEERPMDPIVRKMLEADDDKAAE